jgi:hypothetical protein
MRIDKIISVTFIIFRKNILFYLHTIYKVNRNERKMIGSKLGFFIFVLYVITISNANGMVNPSQRFRTSSRFLARQEEAPAEATNNEQSDGYHYEQPANGFEEGTTTTEVAEETTTEAYEPETTTVSDEEFQSENLVNSPSEDAEQSAQLQAEVQPQPQYQQQYQPLYFLQYPGVGFSQRLVYVPVAAAPVPARVNPQVARAPPRQPEEVEVFQPLASNPTIGAAYTAQFYQQSW